MKWNVPLHGIENKEVKIKHSDITNNKAKDKIFNQLGCVVFLEGVSNHAQAFPRFLGKSQ